MRHRRMGAPWVALLIVVIIAAAVPMAAGPVSAQPADLHGHVQTGPTPLGAYTVTLYATSGTGAPVALGTGTTAPDGSFDISYLSNVSASAVLYVLAVNTAGPATPGSVVLADVLGTGPAPVGITVNELTTAAAGYAMAQFFQSGRLSGPSPGLENAAGMMRNLVDPVSGSIGSVLASPPNVASSVATFNSLGNIVASCIAAQARCAQLFAATTPPGGPAPINTLDAIVSMNHDPWLNVIPLFTVSQSGPMPYSPALATAPDAWTLALRFVGDGQTMSGPGNMAVDAYGNIWVTNNYMYDANPLDSVCGSDLLLEFTPTGRYAPGSPWQGGGLNGAGFGIDIDPDGDIWASNFGFAAPTPSNASRN